MKALLALEDGRTFKCRSFTGPGESQGEVVFNTSMTGYQEVLTDPSYRGQLVTMTYPLVGNYGVNAEDVESDRIQVAAFIIKEYQPFYSNYRATGSLAEYLQSQGVMGIEALDTRALTRHIRKAGAMRAYLSTSILDTAAAVAKARSIPGMEGQDLARIVTTDRPYRWVAGQPVALGEDEGLDRSDLWQGDGSRHRVVALDFGIKYNILRCLDQAGFEVIVVPAETSADTIRAMAPHGIFLSNGPGDPGARDLRHRNDPRSHRLSSHVRYLPGPPVAGPGIRRADLQAQVRSSGCQSAGQASGQRPDRDYLPEPRFCRGPGIARRTRMWRSPTSTSTTRPWKVSEAAGSRSTRFSITRRRRRDRMMRAIFSTRSSK